MKYGKDMSGVEIQFMFHRSNDKIDPERAPPPCRNFSRVASLAFHFHLICHKPLYMRPNFDHCLALSVRHCFLWILLSCGPGEPGESRVFVGHGESAWLGGSDWCGVPVFFSFQSDPKVFSNGNIVFDDSKEFDDPQVSQSLKVFSVAFKVVCSTNKSSCH